MRISIKNATITLGRGEKALWQATTPDGRDVADARKAVLAAARTLAARLGRTVDVYAPKEGGGFMVEQVSASEGRWWCD